jgi:DNA topoisomerase II
MLLVQHVFYNMNLSCFIFPWFITKIQNDGEGIPVQIHQEYNVYVPELIFGHLHTSDNYDDTELRVTGGRNGYGAKLTNIFSTMFTVECADTTTHRYSL